MKNKFNGTLIVLLLLIASNVFISCDFLFDGVGKSNRPVTVHTIDNLSNNSVYMVKINRTEYVINPGDSGRAVGFSRNAAEYQETSSLAGIIGLHGSNERYAPLTGSSRPVIGHPAATALSANPPPVSESELQSARSLSRAPFIPPALYSTRNFWVETYYDSDEFVQKQANLLAIGNHANIWVMSGNSVAFSVTDAKKLADIFDQVYPAAANILGYEYGGGPGGNGGRDGDPRIQILVYDIRFANNQVAASGYFWPKDWYIDSPTSSQRSNQAEMFYLDVSTLLEYEDFIPYLLVHELQHMINWNEKSVKQGQASGGSPAGTMAWYNEMLSMMAEDIILSAIGIAPNNYHPVRDMDIFLVSYVRNGFIDWLDLGHESYAKAYAFGAYLLRNYGGIDLFTEIMTNDSINLDSVSSAISSLNPGEDFNSALEDFAEALLFYGNSVPPERNTFNREVINTSGSFTYTAHAFDIGTISNILQNPTREIFGPVIYTSGTMIQLRPYSVTLYSENSWRNISGSISISVEEPFNSNTEIFFLVR